MSARIERRIAEAESESMVEIARFFPGASTQRFTPSLGMALHGVDLAKPMDDASFAALRALWIESGGVLVVRDQQLEPEQHISFSRQFGPLFGEVDQFQESVHRYLMPGHPQIYRVSNKVQNGTPAGRARAGTYWHSDVSFRERPAMASLLYALELPPHGGDTMFASMYRAFETLSPAMQSTLAPLRAVHDFAVAANTPRRYADGDVRESDINDSNRASHPVVITHPESRRKALFVNPGFTSHLDGFSEAESRPILEFLYAHTVRAEFIYRHVWQRNDLVIWDNRCVSHYAVSDYDGVGDRYLHRTTVLADRPSA